MKLLQNAILLLRATTDTVVTLTQLTYSQACKMMKVRHVLLITLYLCSG